MWQKLAWLAAAGALGTLARYGLSGFVPFVLAKFSRDPAAFPWGTLVVNNLGCLAFGIFWSLGEQLIVSRDNRIIVLTGFMGAFTTFSTYAFETTQMLDDSEWWLAAANVLAQNLLGVVLIAVGMAVGAGFKAGG